MSCPSRTLSRQDVPPPGAVRSHSGKPRRQGRRNQRTVEGTWDCRSRRPTHTASPDRISSRHRLRHRSNCRRLLPHCATRSRCCCRRHRTCRAAKHRSMSANRLRSTRPRGRTATSSIAFASQGSLHLTNTSRLAAWARVDGGFRSRRPRSSLVDDGLVVDLSTGRPQFMTARRRIRPRGESAPGSGLARAGHAAAHLFCNGTNAACRGCFPFFEVNRAKW
jgi:hypothetical protein